MRTLLNHCRVISPGLEVPAGGIVIEDGHISAVFEGEAPAEAAGERIDCGGATLVPGFIDIHTHGAMGADVCDGKLESIQRIASHKLGEGVTTFLPTTLTLPHERLVGAARAVAAYRKNQEFAKTPALHIEGPFLNAKFVGAQNPAFLRPPDAAEIFALRDIAPIALVSVATELPGGVEFVRAMKEAGITTSLAHTAATYAEFLAAKAAGLTHLTHFCCQMTPLHHRAFGVVGAGLLDDEVRIELICDRVHLHAELIELVFKVKPIRQLMLITDSMAASGLGDGEFDLGGMKAIVAGGVARLSADTLAGSTLSYNHGLRNVARITNRPLSELIATTSWNQAQSLGLGQVGRIETGYLADLVLLDDEFEVQATWVEGERRFQR